MNNLLEHRHRDGFTLVELIVVMAIMSILLGLATFAFHDWTVKSAVEAQIRQMATDINTLRLGAMTMKLRESITFNASSYVFKSYSSDNESLSAGQVLSTGNHTVSYPLMRKNNTTAVACAGEVYEIDQRGQLVGSTVSIFINYVGSANPDCLNINTILVNPGKKSATAVVCNDQ